MTSDDFYNMTEEEMDAFMEEMEREHAPFDIEQTWLLKDFLLKFTLIEFGYEYFSVTDGGEKAIKRIRDSYFHA